MATEERELKDSLFDFKEAHQKFCVLSPEDCSGFETNGAQDANLEQLLLLYVYHDV